MTTSDMSTHLNHFQGQDFQEGIDLIENLVPTADGVGLELSAGATQGNFSSNLTFVPSGFDQAVLSWNIAQPEGSDYRAEIRFHSVEGERSPWLGVVNVKEEPTWLWEIDQLTSQDNWDAFQVRASLSRNNEASPSPRIERLTVATMAIEESGLPDPPRTKKIKPIDMPFFCQLEQDPEIGPRICSPTVVAMALGGLGIQASPVDVAHQVYHPGYDLYGIWPLAIHAAFQLGVRGWVEYMDNWERPLKLLRKGVPLVISIAIPEDGSSGDNYPPTEGHLIVLRGVDKDGRFITNDPRFPQTEGEGLLWQPADLAKAWFGHGGVAYVFSRD